MKYSLLVFCVLLASVTAELFTLGQRSTSSLIVDDDVIFRKFIKSKPVIGSKIIKSIDFPEGVSFFF